MNGVLRRGLRTPHVTRAVSSSNARKTFLDYFEGEHDHLLIPSSPVMPDMDPTLSFVNSGMNQFKDVFLGLVTPASRRVVNSQKCIRIKGKHNDLNLVGRDGYHHTFFEMLGNWSFGDYFKKEACSMSWNLLTKVYNIPEDRLYVTYFEGDEALNLPPDTETRDIWAEIGVPRNRVLPFGMRDNFWEMASTGPCGPCTEIHYDHEGRADASSLVNAGSPGVIEIWNLVFMEFNRTGEGLERLGQRFVDTGMGFERLVAVLQGQVSNYETDIFRPLFDVIQKISGHSGYNGRYDGDEMDTAYRILADHARMLTVALGDGMLPNMQNKVRAIFRQAWTLSNKSFKVEKGLIKELSNHVAESLAPAYPEIGRNLKKVHYLIDEEEELIRRKEEVVLKDWARLLERHPGLRNADVDAKREFLNGYLYLTKNVVKDCNGVLSSENAWKLFDTLGVPVKNVADLARILGLEFDLAAYERHEKSLVEESRFANENKFRTEKNLSKKSMIKLSDLGPDPTDDHLKFSYGSDREGGCTLPEMPVKILAVNIAGESAEAIQTHRLYGDDVAVVLDRTNCFHGTREMVSDKAFLEVEGRKDHPVSRVEKLGDKVLHYLSRECYPLLSEVKVNSAGVLKLKEDRRAGLARSWTGLLLLKALLHAKMKVFVETSSRVGNDVFTINFTTYKDNLHVKDVFDLEKSAAEAVKTVVLEWEMRGAKEIASIDHFIRRPGQTFVEAEIPVCKITGPDFTASFPCPGPVLSHVPDLKGLVITSLKKNGYRTKALTAVTGVKAEVARAKTDELLEAWDRVRDFHVAEFADQAVVEERIKMITRFVRRLTRRKYFSHYARECMAEETRSKMILLQKYIKREIRRGFHGPTNLAVTGTDRKAEVPRLQDVVHVASQLVQAGKAFDEATKRA